VLNHVATFELGEGGLEVIQLEGIGPIAFVWCAEHFENLEDLINLGVAHEERFALHHFCEDAPSGPQVDTE